ncbi:Pleckstrin domain [Trinorchestia longiramus]|nr:Pleckstrin domain [Trinorchestia longiramus]
MTRSLCCHINEAFPAELVVEATHADVRLHGLAFKASLHNNITSKTTLQLVLGSKIGMHNNLSCLSHVLEGPGDQEGRLMHKPPKKKSVRGSLHNTGYKEKWFKLVGNLLYYFRLNEHGGVCKEEASGVLVLENVEAHIQGACPGGELLGLALTWKDDVSKSHLFYATSEPERNNWLAKLKLASYESLSAHLLQLRVQIRRRTGKDPLEHALGRPELFPCSASPASSHLAPQLLPFPHSPVSKSQFYTNNSWYGSSPCLSDSVSTAVPQASASQPHSLDVSTLVDETRPGGGRDDRVGPRKASFRCHVQLR